MSTPLENQLFQRQFDDGLIDIFTGLGLVLMSAAWIAELVALGAMAPAILIPFWAVARDRLAKARGGEVAFSSARDSATRKTIVRWVIFGAAVLLCEIAVYIYFLQTGVSPLANLEDFIVGLPAALVGLALLLVALFIRARRFIIYAAFAVAMGALAAALASPDPGYPLAATGVAMIVGGWIMLARFRRNHPLLNGDSDE